MAKLLKIAKTKDVPPGKAAPFTNDGNIFTVIPQGAKTALEMLN
jgi:hypothetical protein